MKYRYRQRLHKTLTDTFNESDLHTICFFLDIEYASLAGNEKKSKLTSLIDYLEKHEKISDFVTIVSEERPHINWPDIVGTVNQPRSAKSIRNIDSKATIEWIKIPAGEFFMGSKHDDWEKPVHKLYLDTFWISRTPITNEQYQEFTNQNTLYRFPRHWKNGKIPKGREDHPGHGSKPSHRTFTIE